MIKATKLINHSLISITRYNQQFYIWTLGYGMTRFQTLYMSFAHNCLLHFRLTTLIMWNHLINFFNFIKKTLVHKSMSNFAKPRVIKLSLRKRLFFFSFQNSLVKSHTTFNFSQQAACLGEVEGVQGKVNSYFFSKPLSILMMMINFPLFTLHNFSRIIFPF